MSVERQLRDAWGSLTGYFTDVEAPVGLIDGVSARRRARRRAGATIIAGAVVAVALAIVLPIVLTGGSAATAGHRTPPLPGATPPVTTSAPRLRRPGPLAAGPHGSVFIADSIDNQIWVLRHGQPTVYAGTGQAGYSGDGGPATDAELHLPSGMAYDQKNRTLYFADESNNRIRAVNGQGVISTVVGGGDQQPTTGARAQTVRLREPTDVTLSPTGHLVIATLDEILMLQPTGRLRVIAGQGAIEGNIQIGQPALHTSADGPAGLAYDAEGDLWVTGLNFKTLYYIDPHGIVHEPPQSDVYARNNGGVVGAPGGGVYVMDSLSIEYRTTTTTSTVAAFLHRPLNGIRAVEVDGLARWGSRLYFDTYYGNGFADGSGVWEMNLASRGPGSNIAPLWIDRHRHQRPTLSGSAASPYGPFPKAPPTHPPPATGRAQRPTAASRESPLTTSNGRCVQAGEPAIYRSNGTRGVGVLGACRAGRWLS